MSCSDSRLEDAEWVTGCGDIIVSNGSIYNSGSWNSTITDANPRTALGIMAMAASCTMSWTAEPPTASARPWRSWRWI